MSKTQAKTRKARLSTRLLKARRALTTEELQFFPKTNSMPDQPRSQWMPTERALATLADRNTDNS